jgi:hypothetical protein
MTMRAAAATLFLLAAAPCLAQTAATPRSAPGTGTAPATGTGTTASGPAANCTNVQVGSVQSYDCINAQLGAVARGTQRFSSDTDAPVGSSSPSNVVGTFNEGATRNRLGRNFGKSAIPYRPPAANPPALPR